MPHSVNGIGTGLVKASRERKIDGYVQFDAIEALILFYIPIIPYKAIHVLSIWQDEHNGEKYESIQLRPSRRLIAKAMFNGWGNVLLVFAGITLLIAGWAFVSMSRPMNIKDWMCLGGLTAAFIGGFLCKSIWYLMNETDERIKDIIGLHDLGTSDPIDWPDEIARSVIKNLMTEANGLPLTSIAQQAITERKMSKAMLCVRLAMRGGQNLVAQKLFDQLMASV